MVACVGDDVFGRSTVDNFRANGVACDHVRMVEGVSTGVAPICVDAEGSNSIVVVGGANDSLGGGDVAAAGSCIRSARVLVCQLEVPIAASLAAMRVARDAARFVVFNPAPARDDLPPEVFS
jgi:ribokinase